MQIVQATFGTFHSFDLARELLAAGHLRRIYSTFPWRRVAREGVPREFVETFPWFHTVEFLLLAKARLSPSAQAALRNLNAVTFDAWLARGLREDKAGCDALIALSGAGLRAGAVVQRRGGKFFCDRGSTHRAFQQRVLAAEYARWGFRYEPHEDRELARELAIYSQADAIVVPSTRARQSFIEEGVDPEKVFAIPYGVQLERFRKIANPPADRFEVLFVGGANLRKGFPYVLKAFARLQHPHKRLRVAGTLSGEIRTLLPRLPQADVEFLGNVPQHELPTLMSSSHVLILPSIEEGLALVQGQALACGCPVLATEATGAEDLFSDGVEGFILPEPNAKQFAAKLQQLAEDPALRQRMSEAALRRVQALGGWHEYGERWTALLHRLTGKT